MTGKKNAAKEPNNQPKKQRKETMPRLAESVYASYYDNVLKMAAKKGGVSRQDLMDGLNISRAIADSLVERCKLVADHKDGRTEYFRTPDGSAPESPTTAPPDSPASTDEDGSNDAGLGADEPALPTQVKAAAVVTTDQPSPPPQSDSTGDNTVDLDAEIVETRNAIKEAAIKAGRALGDWATNQALVDALREKLQQLAFQRVNV